MFKNSLLIATLLSLPTVAVQAMPVCYMEMYEQQIDLSSMCGNSAPSSPLPVPAFGAPEAEFNQLDAFELGPLEPIVEENPVTFQVTKVKYDQDNETTTIKGLVVFPRTSEYGDSVLGEVYDRASNSIIAFISAERAYGQRRINVETTVTGEYVLRNLEGRI